MRIIPYERKNANAVRVCKYGMLSALEPRALVVAFSHSLAPALSMSVLMIAMLISGL